MQRSRSNSHACHVCLLEVRSTDDCASDPAVRRTAAGETRERAQVPYGDGRNDLYIRSPRNVARFFIDARPFGAQPRGCNLPAPLVSPSLPVDHWLAGRPPPMVFRRARYMALFAATVFAVHTVKAETMNREKPVRLPPDFQLARNDLAWVTDKLR